MIINIIITLYLMLNITEVFNLQDNFTLEQLKSSFKSKIQSISNSNLSQIDKDLLTDKYKQYYKLGKQLYWSKMNIELESDEEIGLHNKFNKYNDYYFNFSHKNPFDPLNVFAQMNSKFMDPFYRFDNIFRELDQVKNNFNSQLTHSNHLVDNKMASHTGITNNSQVYSYSNTYKSTTNPDGSRTIIESKLESNNGDEKKSINAYKKMPDGKVVPLTENELKLIDNYSN